MTRELSKGAKLRIDSARTSVEVARAALEAYEKSHAKVITDYQTMIDTYEEAVNKAKALYKENVDVLGDSWAGFRATQILELDAEVLLNLLGPIGQKYVKTKYLVDRDKYFAAVESGDISPAVSAQVEHDIRVSVAAPKRR